MHLTVIGATGRTGVHLVTRALAQGHRVTALVRSSSRAAELLPVATDELSVVVGDVLDPDAVGAAVEGADAVVDVSGPVKGAPSDLRQRAVGHLLDAMAAHDVKRLVFLTGAGVRIDGDEPGIADRVIVGVMKLVQGAVLADGQAAVDTIRSSGLDWTVVRGPRLTDDDPRGSHRIAPNVGGDSSTKIARADLADAILDVVTDPATHGTAPVVSW
jgi:putative NADH-flavin reductase